MDLFKTSLVECLGGLILNKSGVYRSKAMALILWFFLGTLGVHNFYLGRTGIGITQLILTIVGWITVWIVIGIVPLLVVGVWLIIDFIMILTDSNKNLDWQMSE